MPRVGCKTKAHHAVGSMVIQTIKISSIVDKREIVMWLKSHGYRANLVLEKNWWHARQLDPSCFKKDSFRTIKLAHDAHAVVGKLKL